MVDNVDILLSTYNGETYLEELITSLINQTHTSWLLYVRDDGSSDGTISILEKFASQYPHKMKMFADGTNLGVVKSFEFLLKEASGPYFMFCDQDDVWHSDKVEKLMKAMKLHSSERARLVFSDLNIVSKNREQICDSFYTMKRIRPYSVKNNLSRILVENYIPGCSMLINEELKRQAVPFPPHIDMHDHWIAQIVSCTGSIEFVSESLIDYRQHDNNEVGAARRSKSFSQYLKAEHYMKGYKIQLNQLQHLQTRVSDSISIEKMKIISRFIGFLKGERFLISGYRKSNIVEHLRFVFSLIIYRLLLMYLRKEKRA